MAIKDGIDSTEHARALRAEKVAGAVLVAGLLFCIAGAFTTIIIAGEGVALVAFGVLLFASVNRHYSASRGEVKAAAVRRPADTAPKAI